MAEKTQTPTPETAAAPIPPATTPETAAAPIAAPTIPDHDPREFLRAEKPSDAPAPAAAPGPPAQQEGTLVVECFAFLLAHVAIQSPPDAAQANNLLARLKKAAGLAVVMLCIVIATARPIAAQQAIIKATSPTIGPFLAAPGGCLTQPVTVTGAAVAGGTVTVSPITSPGDGITWGGYVSAPNTVTLKVCSATSQYIQASVYSINVLTGAGAGGSFPSTQNAATDTVCAKGGDTIAGLTCDNSSDGTAETAFNSTVTIPPGTLANGSIRVSMTFGAVTSSTAPSLQIKIRFGGISGTLLYSTPSGSSVAGGNSIAYHAFLLPCLITATGSASSATNVVLSCAGQSAGASTANAIYSSSALTTSVNATIAQNLTVTATWSANTAGNAVYLYSISGV